MAKPETQTEWETKMGQKIIPYIKSELYVDFPFLDLAFAQLIPEGKQELNGIATDGRMLFFGPAWLIDIFKSNDLFLTRGYLHATLHCMYEHLWIRGIRNPKIWSLACDIAVEYTIDTLDRSTTRRILSFVRTKIYQALKREGLISAAEIYEFLLENYREQELFELAKEFHVDDHRYWPEKDNSKNPQILTASSPQQDWQKIARQSEMKRNKQDNGETETSVTLRNASLEPTGHRYGDFLKKFTQRREELHVNQDEFELSYYTYGLMQYGNIPLIEPQETREENKIRELVIAIDTSYSTSGELVEGFLKETFALLSKEEYFFRDNRVHVLQCDEKIRQDILITGASDIDRLFEKFQIVGGGSTDFRPVFQYVNEMLETGKWEMPGGLLYFTDGNGVYPKAPPSYPCAFLFLGEYKQENVPAWAMQLKLDKEELLEEHYGY